MIEIYTEFKKEEDIELKGSLETFMMILFCLLMMISKKY
jgi:hypothetical protein